MADGDDRKDFWVWGKRIKDEESLLTPTLFGQLGCLQIRSVQGKGNHAIALDVQGRVFTWGENWAGQLGHNNRFDRKSPSLVKLLYLQRIRVVEVAAGGDHSLALSDNGVVFSWGGQLASGLGREGDPLVPLPIRHLEKMAVVHVSCGSNHALAMTKDKVFSWGRGANGRTGHNNQSPLQFPTRISGLKKIKQIECGWHYSLCLDESGTVFAFGKGTDGQLGLSDPPSDFLVPTPIQKSHFQNKKVAKVFGGFYHSAAITMDGSLFTWGWGEFGQLGTNECQSHYFPKEVALSSLKHEKETPSVCHVGLGGYHTVIARSDGSVLTCGRGDSGQLGQGSNHNRHRPRPIEPFSKSVFLDPSEFIPLGSVINVCCSWWLSIVIADAGILGVQERKMVFEKFYKSEKEKSGKEENKLENKPEVVPEGKPKKEENKKEETTFTCRRPQSICMKMGQRVRPLSVRLEKEEIGEGEKILFMMSGQGAQYINMGLQLFSEDQTFKTTMTKISTILSTEFNIHLLALLYPNTNPDTKFNSTSNANPASHSNSSCSTNPNPHPLFEPMMSQVSLFALECSLLEVWKSRGMIPDVVIGHGEGELAALVATGIVTIEEGTRLAVLRGRAMANHCKNGGKMVVVHAGEDLVLNILESVRSNKKGEEESEEQVIRIAAINSFENIVLSGSEGIVLRAVQRLQRLGIKTRELVGISNAFHSPLMRKAANRFEAEVSKFSFSSTKRQRTPVFVSALGGKVVSYDELRLPQYWSKQMVSPVLFEEAFLTATKSLNCSIIVEVGPSNKLLRLGESIMEKHESAFDMVKKTELVWKSSLEKPGLSRALTNPSEEEQKQEEQEEEKVFLSYSPTQTESF